MSLFNQIKSIKILIALGIFVNQAVIQNIYSQDITRYLEIRGHTELRMKPVSKATIELYDGNTKVKTLQTGAGGSFSFKLEMNKEYIVAVSKKGYVHKKIKFNTKIPDEELGIWVREFAIGLVEYCEGVDYSVLDEPVDVIKYSVRKKDFESDKTFVYKMKTRLENLMINIDQCHIDKYNDLLDKADKLFKEKSYEEARKEYKAANEIFPEEKYPANQISKINSNIGKEKNIDDLYNNTITEADALYTQKRYDEALLKYKGALTLKPQETYSKQKINEIELLATQLNAEKQAKSDADTKYNSLIVKGNSAFAAQNYTLAKQMYSQASEIKPGNIYSSSKIREIDALIAKKAETESKEQEVKKEFDINVAQADNLLKANNLVQAMDVYKKALLLRPHESYPREKIAEIEQKIKDEQEAGEKAKSSATDKEYRAALAQADNYFKLKEYDAAKSWYSNAITIKPSETYPKQQIDRINNLVVAEQARNKQAIEEGYKKAISAGESYITAQQYNQAIQEFQRALTFKPGDAYSNNKISEIDRLIENKSQRIAAESAKNEQYLTAVKKADGLFQMKDYDAAKTEYNKAISVKPSETYPKQQIDRINNLVAAEQARKKQSIEEGYKKAISDGESYIRAQQYNQAKQEFQRALTFKPGDVYSNNKISEIDGLIERRAQRIAAEDVKKEQYQAAIKKADGLFQMKDYNTAKAAYQGAIAIGTGEQYPRLKIQEIDRLMAMEDAKKQREIDDSYKRAIALANNYNSKRQYAQAKSEYENALTYKPDDTYSKNRITEINRILLQEEQRLASETAKKNQYDQLIAKADGLMNVKDYANARIEYEKSSQVLPDETYPRQQIIEINRLIKEQERVLANKQAKENDYKLAVSKADGFFRLEQYTRAKAEYNNALLIKPDEVYPKNKIYEIDKLVDAQLKAQADTKAKEDAYNNSIRMADSFFGQKKYEDAKLNYNKALNYKPGEPYPKGQISKIDNILAQQEKARQEELAKNREYDSYISQADKAFNAADYSNAKDYYQKALVVKPAELYPKQKISKIDEIIKLLAKQKSTTTYSSTSSQSQASTKTVAKKKLADLSFKNDNERDRYLAELRKKYPEGVTLETYKEKYKTTKRFIVIRKGDTEEFRMVHFTNWGGKEYSVNGKPITAQYFESQTSSRSGEYYKEFEF